MNKHSAIVFSLFLCSTLLSAKTLKFKKFPSLRFESAHVKVLDIELVEGVLETESEDAQEINDEMTSQLFYLVGALNGYGGAPDLAHVTFETRKTEQLPGSRLKKITFGAKFHVAWPAEMSSPAAMTFPLPARADEEGLKDFFRRYFRYCSEDGADEDAESFYYYFRPQRQECELNANPQAELTSFSTLKMRFSDENTDGKSPEYGKVWEDGKLVATIIMGTNEAGAYQSNDAGIYMYNTFYQTLWQYYGNPSYMNVNLGPQHKPGRRYPDIEMTFELGNRRQFNINLLLVDKMGLLHPTQEFVTRYNRRTEISDFVSYNGHSGFGDNIKALAKLGSFKKDQYQIYYINGCDTFAYVDDALSDAHMAVNPGEGRYRYFDIITNAMPSPFNGFIQTNLSVVHAMFGMQDTYRTILSRFNSSQKALVMGEEDNKWPNPF